MKRIYRCEVTQERIYLSKRVQELEVVLAPLLQRQQGREIKGETSTILAWKDIANSLNNEESLSIFQQKALKAQVREFNHLMRDMHKWATKHSCLQSSLDQEAPTWRDCTLLSTSHSRQLGKEWIAKRMLHNADRMFQEHGFAAIDSDYRMNLNQQFTFADSGYSIVFRDEFEAFASLDDVVGPATPMVLHEVDGNITQYAFLTPTNEQVNALVAEYRTENRCIMAFRQIQDDEAWASDSSHHIRNRMGWFDAHQLANGKVRFRALSFHYQSYRLNAGCLPLEQDGMDYGIDLGDCPTQAIKETRFELFLRIGVISAVRAHQANEIPFDLIL
ncbi:Aste57867_8642 [Aphanomyces stellatus]|uniref:Aste57867_8642 protein n=1 Tax=Aphanomyces stellatus TaxID=120398 RepID=A0A485KKT3_9STRA|nr:hypothetical protein As57867_008608 [Aphanomyces stellatus]VFT85528.1 Aste57867_8642 [Aphanomyces stellatus]